MAHCFRVLPQASWWNLLTQKKNASCAACNRWPATWVSSTPLSSTSLEHTAPMRRYMIPPINLYHSSIQDRPRYVGVPGMLITWHPLKPVFLKLFGLWHGWRDLLRAWTQRIIFEKFFACLNLNVLAPYFRLFHWALRAPSKLASQGWPVPLCGPGHFQFTWQKIYDPYNYIVSYLQFLSKVYVRLFLSGNSTPCLTFVLTLVSLILCEWNCFHYV